MLRYYEPEKVQMLGQPAWPGDCKEAVPPPREWNNVAVISNGFKYMAIDVSYEEGIDEVARLKDEEDYIFINHYRIPFKFLHYFFGKDTVPNPCLP